MTQPAWPPSQAPYDQWGLLEFPTSTDNGLVPQFRGWGKGVLPAPNEPCLAICADFVACFLVNASMVRAAWNAISGKANAGDAVRSLWLHNPAKAVFSSDHTPSLYFWREGGHVQQDADDWRRSYSQVKGLWVFPTAFQEVQFRRANFGNTLFDAIDIGIERGRDPNWKVVNDPDPLAALQGSLFWSFAGFDEFTLKSWRHARLTIEGATKVGGFDNYQGIEFTFDLVEKVTYGLGRSPPYYLLGGLTDTVQTVTPARFAPWVAATSYPGNSFAVPTVSNGLYYVGNPTGGRSGSTEPTWPTTPGATVVDGSQTWICIGPINGASVSGPIELPSP